MVLSLCFDVKLPGGCRFASPGGGASLTAVYEPGIDKPGMLRAESACPLSAELSNEMEASYL